MSARYALGHGVLSRLVAPSRNAFEQQCENIEEVQRSKLSSLLRAVAETPAGRRSKVDSSWSFERYAAEMPETDYHHWRPAIDEQRLGGASLIASPVQRYQPTSGSTSAIKWLPYTRRFLSELDQAICPWLGDLYRSYPDIRAGSHYWSLSWVPTSLRDELNGQINDDMKLLSFGKRLLAGVTQAVPEAVANAATSEDSRFATLAWLVADESLGVLSVWSPTFALALLDDLGRWRDELAECLHAGHFGMRARSLRALRCPKAPARAAMLRHWDGRQSPAFYAQLWPKLALISAWDTAAAASWAAKLSRLFPGVAFQGKGLWATEGVVTFPWQGKYPLAFRSHVYEFVDTASGKVLPPWALQSGQEVTPLLSTGAGLLRYRMSDRLRVDGMFGKTPCFTFLGRDDGVDLVGEKLSAVMVQQLIDQLAVPDDMHPVTLLGLDDSDGQGTPGYVLLMEASPSKTLMAAAKLSDLLETALLSLFHYRLARDLGQLAPVRVLCKPDMQQCYLGYCQKRGMVDGNVKIEPLRYWPGMMLTDMVADQALEGVA
ncbi:MAG: GH3 auxin-responsive promoter family protein [Alcanivoracaceae bacterium]|nr:GH3 auxin-responsive promoter family protein [Alcanivoracaceae bacterium]